MKNLIIITAMFLLPLAVVGQSETIRIDKHSITGSFILNGETGLAVDYRRRLAGNHQIVFGLEDVGLEVGVKPKVVFGVRKIFKSENKLSFGLGVDAYLKKRYSYGDGVISRTIGSMPRPQYSTVRLVGGAYYKINDKLDLMTEFHMKGLVASIFSTKATSTLNFGLKYGF